jgi:cell division protein FtsI/penicillin-binding protein 2
VDRRRLGVAIGVVVAVAAAALAFVVLGGEDEPGPGVAAEAFAAAWSGGDRDALERLVDEPATLATTDPIAVLASLGATATAVSITGVEESDGEATASYASAVTLGAAGDLDWIGTLRLVDDEERGWLVGWDAAGLHPDLPPGGTLRVATTWPERAPILGAGDQPLVGPTDDVVIGIEPQRLQDRAAAALALQEQLGVDPAAVDALLDASGVQPDHFVPIVQVRRAEYEAVREVIFPIPGLLFREAAGRGGPAPGFARHTVGRFGEVTAERLEALGPPYAVGDVVGLDGLEARFEEQLAGRPEVAVRAVDAEGAEVAVLATFPGTPPAPVRTTLDPALQQAADAALAGLGVPAALVAVDAAIGEVRAISSTPIGDAFNRAIGGAYPPGSTFKVITAHALLTAGTTAETTVDCPPELVVDGRRFQNFEGGASGAEPFGRAFAESCNTAVIGAAEALPSGALAASAEAFGFGVDYTLGPTTLAGSFGEPASEVELAASAIGQAQVTASPLHMATVAAAVLDGTWRSPVLLPGSEAAAGQVQRPLDPAVAESLRSLMRLVVTDGSGTAADVAGLGVIGKSGTAEFGAGDPPPTHAWFIAGAQGLGIAVIVEGGEAGGRVAAPVAGAFLESIS